MNSFNREEIEVKFNSIMKKYGLFIEDKEKIIDSMINEMKVEVESYIINTDDDLKTMSHNCNDLMDNIFDSTVHILCCSKVFGNNDMFLDLKPVELVS